MLLGAILGGVPAADASVTFERTDIALPASPDSVAIGDLDGQHGKDIAIALWSPGSVGVMLNNGAGTFAPDAGAHSRPAVRGIAVDITLGDQTQPAAGQPPAARRQTRRLRRLRSVCGAPHRGRNVRARKPGADRPGGPAVPRVRDAGHCSR
jgi:hypothetical protein